jgi:predicted lipid-binding transport protein (Tim44 family)
LVLSALLFILWAYGMYALISTLSGHRAGTLRQGRSWRRLGWLGLLAGAGVGLGLALALAQSFDEQHQDLKLAGFLGTVWAEGWPGKLSPRLEEPPIKGTASGDQPGYAMLNPGTPSAELARKTMRPMPKPTPKPKIRKAPGAKGTKAAAQNQLAAAND